MNTQKTISMPLQTTSMLALEATMMNTRKTVDITLDLEVMAKKLDAIVNIMCDYFVDGEADSSMVELIRSSLAAMSGELHSYSDSGATIQEEQK